MELYNHITVFEHQTLRLGENGLTQQQLESLQTFYGEQGVPYFSLIHQGVKFNAHVGVLQVGDTTIEVLPKTDRQGTTNDWRNRLIGMLLAVGTLKVTAPSSSVLSLQPNSILELYIELFIHEVEYLLKRGLIKQYSKREGQLGTLKGRFLIHKQVSKNMIHKERFHVNYTNYDQEHLLHQVLHQAILLVCQLNSNPLLSSRLAKLRLDFPKVPIIAITEKVFTKIPDSRKTLPYQYALSIARLLLLNYHPDLQQGRQHVLALMFDMNTLWEQFVFVSLCKYKKEGVSVEAQQQKPFWSKHESSTFSSAMRADIVLRFPRPASCVVLDTKWKYFATQQPSATDLRQLYVYLKYFGANKVGMVYPSNASTIVKGRYYKENDNAALSDMECSMLPVQVETNILEWQKRISERIWDWVGE